MANSNTNNNNNHQPPFWESMHNFGPHPSMRTGAGVDHAGFGATFPLFPGQGNGPDWTRWAEPWSHGWHGGRHGGHGRHGRHGFQNYRDVPRSDREEDENENEEDEGMESAPETMRNTPDESVNSEAPPPPPGSFPHPPPPAGGPHQGPPHPFHHGPPHAHGFGGPRGRGGRHGRRGGRRGPSPSWNGPFDFRPLMHAFASHPYAMAFRDYMDHARENFSGDEQESAFTPPVDVFNTDKAYVLHVSLPGAKKEDISVSWDGEKVNITGVVSRPGDEAFISTLATSERKVGMFERSIRLPPVGSNEKEDIDGVGITAKMENGILVVFVPKTEKEWTQIHKVEIQ